MIEPTRHQSVFSPSKFGNTRIDVIGCGATGSRIALSLAKLGVMNLHLWDFDKVEEHNIPNQIFNQGDIGSYKVDATSKHIFEAVGSINQPREPQITIHNEPVTGKQPLGAVVFLLTDTMKSRKEIWEGAIKFKMNTKLMIETRMGIDEGRIYSVDPMNLEHGKAYETTLYEDKDAAVSACGTSISVGPTAEVVSGLAVWQFIRWFNLSLNIGSDQLDNEILFYMKPPTFACRTFA